MEKKESRGKWIELDFLYVCGVRGLWERRYGVRVWQIALLLRFLRAASPEFLFTADAKEFCRSFYFDNLFSDVQLPKPNPSLCADSRIALGTMDTDNNEDRQHGSHQAIDTMT